MFITVDLVHTNQQRKKSHYSTIQLKVPADFFPLPHPLQQNGILSWLTVLQPAFIFY